MRSLLKSLTSIARNSSLTGLYAAIACCLFIVSATPAQACVVSPTTPANFGTLGSTTVYNSGLNTSSSATGITCQTLLSVLDNSYIGLKIIGPIQPLKHESFNDTIPLSLAWTSGGADLETDKLLLGNSATILGLLHTTGGQITLHFRTQATTGIRAGKYATTVQLRWYYSVCLVGALGAVCVAPTNSPGLDRFCLLVCGSVTDWGEGRLVSINVQLEVKKDCTITATAVNFDSAALPDLFPTVANHVDLRCTAGASYSIGLDQGKNAISNTRHMRNAVNGDLMAYDIWKGATGEIPWGDTGSERIPSSAGIPIVNSGLRFTYRAKIKDTQNTGTSQRIGNYKDTLRVSVAF